MLGATGVMGMSALDLPCEFNAWLLIFWMSGRLFHCRPIRVVLETDDLDFHVLIGLKGSSSEIQQESDPGLSGTLDYFHQVVSYSFDFCFRAVFLPIVGFAFDPCFKR